MQSNARTSFASVLCGLLLLVGSAATTTASVGDLDDLNYWGSGANRTGLALFWNDGKTQGGLAWGYRWDEATLTVEDMLVSLAAADPGLFIRLDSGTGYGTAVFGIGYGNSGSFSVTGAEDPDGNATTVSFTDGISDTDTDSTSNQAPASSANAGPANASDRYVEGWWDNGFWEGYNSGSDNYALQASATYPSTWIDSFSGVSGTTLVDDAWFAFSFAPGFTSDGPTGRSADLSAAVPEPAWAGLLCGIACMGLLVLRRRASTR